MSTHIYNQLQVIGTDDEVGEVFNYIIKEEEEGVKDKYFDFEKIKPIDSTIDITASGWEEEYWGTSWAYFFTAYDPVTKPDYMEFISRNTPPIPIIIELSKIFSNIQLRLIFEDEIYMEDLWIMVFKDGKKLSEQCLDVDEQVDLDNHLYPKAS